MLLNGVRTGYPSNISTQKQHGSQQQTAESFIAALLFAAHPIHTEAVAGIVGLAELLSAAISLTALLAYIAAARSSAVPQHYSMLAVSILTLWAAALAKEIGITMVSNC